MSLCSFRTVTKYTVERKPHNALNSYAAQFHDLSIHHSFVGPSKTYGQLGKYGKAESVLGHAAFAYLEV
jgi:hypothetical protein